jgi:hypothetical protein
MIKSLLNDKLIANLGSEEEDGKQINELIVCISDMLGTVSGLVNYLNEDATISLIFTALTPLFIKASTSFIAFGGNQLIDASISVISKVLYEFLR